MVHAFLQLEMNKLTILCSSLIWKSQILIYVSLGFLFCSYLYIWFINNIFDNISCFIQGWLKKVFHPVFQCFRLRAIFIQTLINCLLLINLEI